MKNIDKFRQFLIKTEKKRRNIILVSLGLLVLSILIGIGISSADVFFGTGVSKGEINLSRGLVGHWKLDGDAKDSTPYGNNGIAYGNSSSTTDRHNQANSAYSFPGGADDYIRVADGYTNTIKGDDTHTVSLWMKGNIFSNTPIIICADTASNYFFLETNSTGSQLYWGYSTFRTYSSDVSSGWHHVVMVKTGAGDSGNLYLDGILQTSYSGVLGSVSDSSSHLLIGDYPTSGYNFNGSIDDVRVYNRSLSTDEVLALYDGYNPSVNLSTAEKGLIGYWKLDGNAKDSTPYGNDGTIYGNASSTTDRHGQANYAYNFGGGIDKIITGTYFPEISTEFTVSAFVKPGTAQIAYANIWGNHGGSTQGIVLQQDNASTNNYYLAYGDSSDWHLSSNASLTADVWQHVIAIKTTTALKIYVDGVEVVNTPDTGTVAANPVTNFRIGLGYSSGRNFNGSIDDVRVYNRALSVSEVSDLYHSYNPGIHISSLQKGLVLDMPLTTTYTKGGAVGSEVMADRTPYENDGTNHGAVVGSASTTFDGSDDYIDLTDPLSIFDDSFTISMWAKIPSDASGRVGVLFGDFGLEGIAVNFEIHDDGQTRFYWGGSPDIFGSVDLRDNNWHMITFVRDKANDKVYGYIDTTVDINYSGAIADKTATVPHRIGRDSRTGDTALDGSLSNLKVYNRALDLEEIEYLYSLGRL
jgi:hypothetical protein